MSGEGSGMKCSICGRKLKNQKSMELGYGPVCYKNKFSKTDIKSKGNCHKDLHLCKDNNLIHVIPGQMTFDDYLAVDT